MEVGAGAQSHRGPCTDHEQMSHSKGEQMHMCLHTDHISADVLNIQVITVFGILSKNNVYLMEALLYLTSPLHYQTQQAQEDRKKFLKSVVLFGWHKQAQDEKSTCALMSSGYSTT